MQEDEVETKSLDLKHSIDIISKWSQAMAKRWHGIRERMVNAGINQGKIVNLFEDSGIRVIATQGFSIEVIYSNREESNLEVAINSKSFNVSLLPKIRESALKKFEACERMIEKAIKESEEKEKKRKETVREVLSGVIDDFGADVMRYGNAEEKGLAHIHECGDCKVTWTCSKKHGIVGRVAQCPTCSAKNL